MEGMQGARLPRVAFVLFEVEPFSGPRYYVVRNTSEHAVHHSRRSEHTVQLWVERTLSWQHNHGGAATR